jgi:hypothetical protein
VITREPVTVVEHALGSVTSGRYTVTVTRLRRDGDRWVWGWEIVETVPPGHTRIVSSGDDMSTPWNYGGGTMLQTLAGFLDAHAESDGYPGAENSDLFDHPCDMSTHVAGMIGDAIGWDSWGED